MQFFRGMVIGTLNFVAFLFFIAVIVAAVWGGYTEGANAALEAAREAGRETAIIELPNWAWAIIYGVVGYIVASVMLGILFVLLDIQDGIRDLIRVTKGEPAPAKKA